MKYYLLSDKVPFEYNFSFIIAYFVIFISDLMTRQLLKNKLRKYFSNVYINKKEIKCH